MTDVVLKVSLWGQDVAAVVWDKEREYAVFEYLPEFPASGLDVAPLYWGCWGDTSPCSRRKIPELQKPYWEELHEKKVQAKLSLFREYTHLTMGPYIGETELCKGKLSGRRLISGPRCP